MPEGYDRAEENSGSEAWLDELLCEYVDGTMDPSVRAAFEEYLRANPHLAEHVACLCRARQALCRYGCAVRAPHGFQHKLRHRLAVDQVHTPLPLTAHVETRLGAAATFASTMALMLMVGMFAGAILFTEEVPAVAAHDARPAGMHADPGPFRTGYLPAAAPLHALHGPGHQLAGFGGVALLGLAGVGTRHAPAAHKIDTLLADQSLSGGALTP